AAECGGAQDGGERDVSLIFWILDRDPNLETRMTAWNRRGLSFAGVSVLGLCALGASLAKPQGQQGQPQQSQAQQNQTEPSPAATQQTEDPHAALRRAYADE